MSRWDPEAWPVARYLRAVDAEYPPPYLAADEERALAARAEAGDDAAVERLVVNNLRWVVSLARRYRRAAARAGVLSLEDMVQEGNVGLILAARRFRADRGTRFSTYATYWIMQAIRRAVANRGRTVRVPVYVHDALRRLARARDGFRREHGRLPDAGELAAAMGASLAQLATLDLAERTAERRLLRLDMGVAGPGGDPITLAGVVAAPPEPEPPAIAGERGELELALAALDPRDRLVLEALHGLLDGGVRRLPLQAVGDALGLTRERVRQIAEGAREDVRRTLAGRARRRQVTSKRRSLPIAEAREALVARLEARGRAR